MDKKGEVLKTHIFDMMRMVLEEFNCNHAADLEEAG